MDEIIVLRSQNHELIKIGNLALIISPLGSLPLIIINLSLAIFFVFVVFVVVVMINLYTVAKLNYYLIVVKLKRIVFVYSSELPKFY